jgi:digeranylgeranylglycerophospholipid reductase
MRRLQEATSGSFQKAITWPTWGLGILGSKSKSVSSGLLKKFMKERLPDGKAIEMVVGGDPVAGVMETTTADGVMLVGDAARQTDSLTGGGILNAMKAGQIAGQVAAKAVPSEDVSKSGLREYEALWREAMEKHLQRSYEYKEFFVKLTDGDLNNLIGSLKREDISKMDLRGMLRVMFRLNPKLLWDLRHLIV